MKPSKPSDGQGSCSLAGSQSHTTDERIVAVLHDVCEDCPGWTFERLRKDGFPDYIIEALLSVTKRDGEEYEDFVRRVQLPIRSAAA
jgi:hypothetical protein